METVAPGRFLPSQSHWRSDDRRGDGHLDLPSGRLVAIPSTAPGMSGGGPHPQSWDLRQVVVE
jgi:hypothetical protein